MNICILKEELNKELADLYENKYINKLKSKYNDQFST